MSTHLDAFINHLKIERELSSETVYNYKLDIEQFLLFIDKEVSLVTADDIVGFLAYLKDEGKVATTRNRKLSSLKTFFKYLARKSYITHSPAADIEGAKQERKLPKPISAQALDNLFGIIDNIRDRALFEILYGCGVRRKELVGIRLPDMDFVRGYVRVMGKGGVERSIPLRGTALQAAKELATTVNGPWLFEGEDGHLSRRQVNAIVTKWRKVIGLDWVTPHKFRHSFATHMYNNGMELKVVQELLGHADPSTTQIYTKVENQRISDDYEQFHPRAKSAAY